MKKLFISKIALLIFYIFAFSKVYSKDVFKEFNFYPSSFPIIFKFDVDQKILDVFDLYFKKNNIDSNILSTFNYSSIYFFSSQNTKTSFFLLNTKKKQDFLIDQIHQFDANIKFEKSGNNFYSVVNNPKDLKMIIYNNGFILWIINSESPNYNLKEIEKFLFLQVSNDKKVKENKSNFSHTVKKEFNSSKLFMSLKMNNHLLNQAKYFKVENLLKNLQYSYVKVDFSLKNWSLNLVYPKYMKGKKELLASIINNQIEANFSNLLWVFESIDYVWDKNTLKLMINFNSSEQILNLLTLGVLYYSDKLNIQSLVSKFQKN